MTGESGPGYDSHRWDPSRELGHAIEQLKTTNRAADFSVLESDPGMARSTPPTVDEEYDRPPVLVRESDQMPEAARSVAAASIGIVSRGRDHGLTVDGTDKVDTARFGYPIAIGVDRRD
jgi:hypothetical protein